MNLSATLTKRENQVAGMLATGEPKKIIADRLFISEHTVNTTAKNIYEKTEVRSIGQLATWWFCKKFKIPIQEVINMAISFFFLLLAVGNEFNTDNDSALRCSRAKVRTVKVRTVKRKSYAC